MTTFNLLSYFSDIFACKEPLKESKPPVSTAAIPKDVLKDLFLQTTTKPITSEEKSRLISMISHPILAEESLSSFDQSLIAKIQSISDEIISCKHNPADTIQRALEVFDQSSMSQHQAIDLHLAKLVLAAEKFQMGFAYILSRFISQTGRAPNPEELSILLNSHNLTAMPRLDLAGITVSHVAGIRIFYNKMGFLEPSTLMDRIVKSPMPINCNFHLTQENIQKIKSLYTSLADGCPYNNASPLLEFMKFFKEAKSSNPSLALKDAFTSFNPDPVAIFDKYQGGTCATLSAKVGHALTQSGYQSSHVGLTTENSWNMLPLINDTSRIGIPWDQQMSDCDYISHVRTIVKFETDQHEQGALVLEAGFEMDRILEYTSDQTSSAWQKLEDENFTTEFKAITTLDSLLKKRIKANFKVIIAQPHQPRSLLGIDLLQGAIFLSSQGMKDLTDLPLNAEGLLSISMQGLQNEQEGGIYFVNGQERSLTHRQAFHQLCQIVQERFQLPQDFEENVLTLAENINELFSTVSIEPLELLKTYYPQIKTINAAHKSLLDKHAQVAAISPQTKIESKIQDAFLECSSARDEIERQLQSNSEENLRNAIARYLSSYDIFTALQLEKSHDETEIN
jgi:hypothetical protein